ncbi:hypothetical protein Gohar_008649 [Gossypium harknessii]|uniref:DUF4283 domain-containing protein n=1 Tax=Gossypium harknessii TaxID=34285 RepID=A0A7J9GKC8_9ROSI|nr:hypothetical protein [Gossypium harknessii]
MENELAQLSINEEEDEVIKIQENPGSKRREEFFQLVGCFLTESTIHFPAMKSTMANLWHPIRGVCIRDLGEKRYLFQFFHSMDMERVLKGSHWTFNNHLLILYKLQWGEDSMQVPLALTPFWVQIHEVPIGLYSESLAVNLGNFLGSFTKYDVSKKENRNFMRVRVQVDIRCPLKRKKLIEYCGRQSYVNFKYERLTPFYFFYEKLGHNDSFCEAKMMAGVEIAEMGWDLPIRAQSQRALTMKSVWLREEQEGGSAGIHEVNRKFISESRGMEEKKSIRKIIDPILGINLDGGFLRAAAKQANSLMDNDQQVMEHDLEDIA